MRRRPFLQALGTATLTGFLGGSRRLGAESPRRYDARDGGWSFVLLPDTQCYTRYHPDVFFSQTEWIARQRETRNIEFVLHLGDITDQNTHPEWQIAWNAMKVIRDEAIPHLLVPGNHDLGPWGTTTDRASHMSDYFIQRRSMEHGRSENSYLPLTIGESKLLIVGLEFGPRDAAIAWANRIVAEHPDHHAILVTHAYMYSDETRHDWAGRGPGQHWNPHSYGIGTDPALAAEGANDGEELWQKLVSRHPQFAFTFNGHVINDGVAHLVSRGAGGSEVHQMLVNYQCGAIPDRRNGGGGFLRLVEVHPDGHTIALSDYSPYYDEWLTDPDRKFTITLDRDLNRPFSRSP